MMLKKGKYESWVYEALPSLMYTYSAVVFSMLPYILAYNVTVLIGLL
jgi:hypothetical protein